MRSLVRDSIGEDEQAVAPEADPASKGKGKIPAGRDDDTHYFDSYAENGMSIAPHQQVLTVDIHEIMLKDTTRTVSYAKFILSNPAMFKNAIVLDVGCGTGILSSESLVKINLVPRPMPVFAARAGAKQVFAIEASGLASKARENIKNNGLESIITFVSKVPCDSC